MQEKSINLSMRLFNGLAVVMGLLIAAFPTALIALPKGSNIILLMLILSLIGLILNRRKTSLNKLEKNIIFAFALYFVLVAINVWWFDSDLRNLDMPSRLVLVLPIFFFIRKSNISFNWFIGGITIAAFVIAVNQIIFKINDVWLYSFQSNSGIITLYASILGLMCLFFINKNKSIVFNLVFAMAVILAILTSLLSGGRGVWISAVLSIAVIMFINPFEWGKNTRVFLVLGVAVVLLVAYLTPQTGVKVRVDDAITNVVSWVENEKPNTSSGARLEMWKASYEIIKENPIIGVGKGNFKKYKQVLIDQGKIVEYVAVFDHPHNEYLANFVELGLIGLLSFMLIFFTSVKYFLNIMKDKRTNHREMIIALSGMLVVLHYLFYSFTNGVFDHQSTTIFYSVLMVVIIGLIKPGPRAEA